MDTGIGIFGMFRFGFSTMKICMELLYIIAGEAEQKMLPQNGFWQNCQTKHRMERLTPLAVFALPFAETFNAPTNLQGRLHQLLLPYFGMQFPEYVYEYTRKLRLYQERKESNNSNAEKGLRMYASYGDYLVCAAWSSTNDDGEPLDLYQFSAEAEKKLKEDLDDFVGYCETNYAETLLNYEEMGGTPEQFAHDFWLTRNGHGAGFWDRGLGEVGDTLAKAAKTFGSCDLYLNEETQEIEVY